jgi:hypothetical protein
MILKKLYAGMIFSALLSLSVTAQAGELQAKLFATDDAIPAAASMQYVNGSSLQSSPSSGGIFDSKQPRKITRGGAMLRSLIIPGWGESYLGYHSTARWFFWADVAIWASVIGFKTYSIWKENQFIAFATTHSGAKMNGKTDAFYADIGNYNSTEEYNAARLRERDYEALYTSSAYYWSWDTKANRLEYDDMRIDSKSAHNKIYFFLGAAALNRLISFIDTGKKARDVLKSQNTPQMGFHVVPEARDGDQAIHLVFQADF